MIYSKEVMRHFKSPKNLGEIKKPDGVGTVGNPRCGDVMKLYIQVEVRDNLGKKEEYVKDIKFQTLGCGAAIACSSMTTELVKGKSLTEALKISNKKITAALGELPPAKYHCSILSEEAIKEAIKDYLNKKNAKN